jgi:hypothetical protein
MTPIRRWIVAILEGLQAPATVATLALVTGGFVMLGMAARNWSLVLWAEETRVTTAPLPFGTIVKRLAGPPERWTMVANGRPEDICSALPRDLWIHVLRFANSNLVTVSCGGQQLVQQSADSETRADSWAGDSTFAALDTNSFVLLDHTGRVVYGSRRFEDLSRTSQIVALFGGPRMGKSSH